MVNDTSSDKDQVISEFVTRLQSSLNSSNLRFYVNAFLTWVWQLLLHLYIRCPNFSRILMLRSEESERQFGWIYVHHLPHKLEGSKKLENVSQLISKMYKIISMPHLHWAVKLGSENRSLVTNLKPYFKGMLH